MELHSLGCFVAHRVGMSGGGLLFRALSALNPRQQNSGQKSLFTDVSTIL